MYSILIIDDEPIVKIALRSILPWEEHGFSICGTASNGLEAMSLIEKHQPDPEDPIDVLAKVGGLDIAGMTGVFLGGAALGVPIVIDGFISCVSALIAQRICPVTGDYMIASHVSKEPAAQMILSKLGLDAMLDCEMHLGEGTGALTLFPILDLACVVYNSMSTFEEASIEQYEHLV